MKNFTLSAKVGLLAIGLSTTTMASAETFTAVASGAWSSAATWQGGNAPTSSLGVLDQVIIESGVTVTLDNTIIVDGVLSYIDVQGTLTTSADGALIINSGSLVGDGLVMLDDIVLGTQAAITYTGQLTVNTMTTTATNIQLAAEVMVNESLTLSEGAFNVISQGMYDMQENATIIVQGGLLALNGGSIGLANAYNVIYQQGSSTAGFEVTGAGLNDVTIDVGVNNSVTMTSDWDIDGMFSLTSGTLILAGNDLTLNSGFSSTTDASISSTETSDITLNLSGNATGAFYFSATGNDVHDFNVNIGSGNELMLNSNLNVHGSLNFMSGSVNISTNQLAIETGAVIQGAGEESYVITATGGALGISLASAGSSFTAFPVGTDENYMPAAVQLNGGASSTIWIGADAGVYSEGTSGNNLADAQPVVNGTWFIESEVTSNVSANVQFMWNADVEVNGFNNDFAYVGHYTNSAWQAEGVVTQATEVNGMFMLQANSLTSFSPFAIMGESAVTSISETENEAVSVRVYPNPSTDFVTVAFANDLQNVVNMDIVDAYGKVVANYKLTGNNANIDVSSLPTGNYFIRLFNTELKMTKTLIKL